MRKTILMISLGLLLVAPGWAVDRNVPSQYATIVDALGAAGSGDRVVINGQHTEAAEIWVSNSGVTITSGAARADIREARFLVLGSNITFLDVDINGKSVGGVRNPATVDLVVVSAGTNNITFDGCRIVNPASSEFNVSSGGNTASNDEDAQHSPATCIEIRTEGAVTIRNCDFRNDDDKAQSGIVNEVCVHFGDLLGGGPGPYLVENSTFRYHSKAFSISHGFDNITIRNNTCDLSDDGPDDGSSCALYMNTDFRDPTGVVQNLVFEGNTVEGAPDDGDGAGSRGIFLASGKVDNVVVRNNTFLPELTNNAFRSYARGANIVFENNTVDVRTGNGVGGAIHLSARTSYTTINALPAKHPELAIRNIVIRDNLVTGNNGQGLRCDENLYGSQVIEDNVFLDVVDVAVDIREMPFSALIRGNEFERCATGAGVGNAAVNLAAQETAVTGNYFKDCLNGITIRSSGGAYGAVVNPFLDRAPRNLVLSRNIILRMSARGMADDSTDSGTDGQGTWTGRSRGIWYVNNTIANSGGTNLVVHGDDIRIYNNLFIGAPNGSIQNSGATITVLGFNLLYNTAYNNVPLAPTDIVSLLPPVLGGALPSSRAAVDLRPNSLALDAGSSDGLSPDYITDIGAVEMGANIDTAVAPANWEVYR